MLAQQRLGDHLLAAHNLQSPITFGQKIALTLTDKRITSAQVTVHGLVPKGRLVQSTASPENSFGRGTRSLTVSFTSGQDDAVSADLALPGLTAVISIELDTLTYADGTVWHVSADRPCRVAPDPLMLITSR
jgi:hypothetical protein